MDPFVDALVAMFYGMSHVVRFVGLFLIALGARLVFLSEWVPNPVYRIPLAIVVVVFGFYIHRFHAWLKAYTRKSAFRRGMRVDWASAR